MAVDSQPLPWHIGCLMDLLLAAIRSAVDDVHRFASQVPQYSIPNRCKDAIRLRIVFAGCVWRGSGHRTDGQSAAEDQRSSGQQAEPGLWSRLS